MILYHEAPDSVFVLVVVKLLVTECLYEMYGPIKENGGNNNG